jgi:predicted AAA+ superfamily ATPase
LFGGFPEVVLENDNDKKLLLLQQYFEDIIHKDIIDRYNIRNSKQLIELARYLVVNAGSKVSYNKLSKVFGLSDETIKLYVGYMIDAFLLFEVTYFSYSAKIKHDITKLSKLYVTDNGLVNVVSVKYSKDKGKMFENTVLIKLLEKYDEISYWSELKSEVDFVIKDAAINVTATDKLPAREFKGLEDFQKKHKNFNLLLITESTTKDNIISITDFLKEN